MITWRGTRAAYGLAAAVLLAAGFWGGKSVPRSTATPQVVKGTVREVGIGGDEFVLRADGTDHDVGFGLPDTISWRDRYGNWHDGSHPSCMKPLSHGQHVTVGFISAQPVGAAPGGTVLVWFECPRVPLVSYPVVTPQASGSP